MSVIIETTLGDITVDLYVNERPRTSLNFLKLCKVKFYNNCLFHIVQRSFIAQTGDPTGTGRGGESIFRKIYGDQAKFFDAEKVPKIKHKRAGMLSMVNDGNGYHGSQILFTLADNLDSLDGIHSVFGEVAEGMDILMKINEAFCDKDNRPYQDIRITHTVILDDPLDDPAGLIVPDHSPDPTEEEIEGCFRIGADESINDDEGLDEEEVKKRDASKEAKHSAQVLEIIGDIPDKDVKPPDNVLFVCKLNSVTTDEDLEIIFSRFGTILSCEIIRDYKTGDSLQYAFIEFETSEMCEKAYHKMDNVLIDDRRIHVDFSQSVSKMKFPRQNKPETNLKTDHSSSPRQRDMSVERHRSKQNRGDRSSSSRHKDNHRNKKRFKDLSPRRYRKRSSSVSPSRDNKHDRRPEKVRKEKKKRRKHSYYSDEEISSDKEVRCGKHRKRSLQKDDKIKSR